MKKRIQKKKKKMMIERNLHRFLTDYFTERDSLSSQEQYPTFVFSEIHQNQMKELFRKMRKSWYVEQRFAKEKFTATSQLGFKMEHDFGNYQKALSPSISNYEL